MNETMKKVVQTELFFKLKREKKRNATAKNVAFFYVSYNKNK